MEIAHTSTQYKARSNTRGREVDETWDWLCGRGRGRNRFWFLGWRGRGVQLPSRMFKSNTSLLFIAIVLHDCSRFQIILTQTS